MFKILEKRGDRLFSINGYPQWTIEYSLENPVRGKEDSFIFCFESFRHALLFLRKNKCAFRVIYEVEALGKVLRPKTSEVPGLWVDFWMREFPEKFSKGNPFPKGTLMVEEIMLLRQVFIPVWITRSQYHYLLKKGPKRPVNLILEVSLSPKRGRNKKVFVETIFKKGKDIYEGWLFYEKET